jgi:hypothetical protein
MKHVNAISIIPMICILFFFDAIGIEAGQTQSGPVCEIGANYGFAPGFWRAVEYRGQVARPEGCLSKDEFSELGLTATRCHFPWGVFDPESKNFGPEFVRKFLDYVYPEDVNIVLGIWLQHPSKTKYPGTPWMLERNVYPARDLDQFRDDVIAFMKVILKDPRIKYVQIGNEPFSNWNSDDSTWTWNRKWMGTPEEWAQQVAVAARAVYSVDSNITILTGGQDVYWIRGNETNPYLRAVKILVPEPGKPVVPTLAIDMHYYGPVKQKGYTLKEYVDGWIDPFFDSLGVDWTVTETSGPRQNWGWHHEIKDIFYKYRSEGLTMAELLDTARVYERKYLPQSIMLPENDELRERLKVEQVHTRVNAFASGKRCRLVLWWGIWGFEDDLPPAWRKPFGNPPPGEVSGKLARDWRAFNLDYQIHLCELFVDGKKTPLADALKKLAAAYREKELKNPPESKNKGEK